MMNTEAKMFNKILANRVHQYAERIICYDPGICSRNARRVHTCTSTQVIHHVNKLKNKNHATILRDAQKAFEKTQYPLTVNILNSEWSGNIPQHDKGHTGQAHR